VSLRRHAAHVDKNHKEIVDGLRAAGCSVEVVSKKDFPDLLVGVSGLNLLMEVKRDAFTEEGKDGYTRQRKGGKLSKGQQEWHDAWRGQTCVVRNLAHALAVVAEALAARHIR
jgi:hypothetical protein